MAEALQQAGHIAAVYPLGTFLAAPSPDFDIYVFHRPSAADERLRTTLHALEQLQRVVIADIDRHVFPIAEGPPAADATNEFEALKGFSKITTSTGKLAEIVREALPGVDVHVSPDSIPKSLIGIHLARNTHLQPRPHNAMAYFPEPDSPGTAFRRIWDIIYKVLSENEESTLTVFGELDAPGALRNHPRVSVAPSLQHPYRISVYAEFGCILAPALPDDPSRCRSRADYAEAALAGCTYISAPLPDFPPLRQANLKVAPHTSEWYEHLTDAMANPPSPKDLVSCFERTVTRRAARRFVGPFLKFAGGAE